MSTTTRPSPHAANAPSGAASASGTSPDIHPGVEIPLVDWGSLALRAGRVAPVLPHIAWVLRFGDDLSPETVTREARRLAATPYGLGRRIVAPRVPGGRHRWRQEPTPPPVSFRDQPLAGADALSAWLDRELGVPLDPERDAGWRMCAAPMAGGGTTVLITMHHLFGTGGGILGALYGGPDVDPTVGTTEARFAAGNDFTVWRETAGVGDRFRLGLLGAGRLVGSAAQWRGRSPDDDPRLGTLPRPLAPPRGRDRTRRPPSNLRVAAIAALPATDWDGAAVERGGTGNTLLAAVAANLLRRAREARGARMDRTLRLLLPVDLTDREVQRLAQRSSGPAAAMTTAEVVVPGGAPVRGGLADLRATMKAAFIRDSDRVPTVRGAGDVMRLLPEALTFRAAARVALRFDGCASNVGDVPAAMLKLGSHVADGAAMLGFPIGNEAITVLIRYRDTVAVAVVTDPLRLGAAPDLRAWLAEELAGWGLSEVVW
jgi:diacylglycerol O-acyltransferase / wax synthase